MILTLDALAQSLCNSFHRDTTTWHALKAAGLEGPWRDVANTALLALRKGVSAGLVVYRDERSGELRGYYNAPDQRS